MIHCMAFITHADHDTLSCKKRVVTISSFSALFFQIALGDFSTVKYLPITALNKVLSLEGIHVYIIHFICWLFCVKKKSVVFIKTSFLKNFLIFIYDIFFIRG